MRPPDANHRMNGDAPAVPLGDLLRRSSVGGGARAPEAIVRSVEYDSRRVGEGCLFVAITGFVTDGHRFVEEAARRGAVAALVEKKVGASIPEIVVPDTRAALGLVAHEFYGRPSERLKVHTITGTNGKTTASCLVDSILRADGARTGVIGTLGYRVDDRRYPGDRTSPESLDLAKLMASMVDVEVAAVTMEVSSHALALKRAEGMKIDTATFTNLSRDHLDFHGSLEKYAAAKRLLFEALAGAAWKPGSTAIVNADDPCGRDIVASLRSSPRVRTLTFGMSQGDIHASSVRSTAAGTEALFVTPAGAIEVRLRLISAFNVMNALAATGVAVSQNIGSDAIAAGLEAVDRVEGRLQLVDGGQDFTVVVDYAHTPDALEKVIGALRELSPRRLLVVFGCGGDRDRGKRPLMGAIAAGAADLAIVTSDNPRTESPGAIIEDILAGTKGEDARAEIEVIENRRDAIRRAVAAASAGDIVLVAGKGHEDYQIVGTEKLRFDDREEVLAAVADLRSGRL
ncbi:MAG: UDP-N-acetylmuramoyl-L-alanyl-D-glutamate--2,6-diaminopimelate ligase [Candidatus Eisenbacteria bacterium]|nr:UDP-N-acetylmuramoyl-L-alanyl-D-glutamate--2,6-diaminopimelate ligase [Candidatus Eisenbacteria bacterium]